MVETDLHLKRQYLIDSTATPPPAGFTREMQWNGYTIYAGSSLPLVGAASDGMSVLLLGHAVHHGHPEWDNERVVQWLAQSARSTEQVMTLSQDCGGRFVLLISDGMLTAAVPDACAMRHVYWHGGRKRLVISSSPRLLLQALGKTPELDNETRDLLENSEFRTGEYAWYGDSWYDRSVRKVLANHYLDMTRRAPCRSTYRYNGPRSYEDVLHYAAALLNGLFKGIHARFQVLQPLTAGYDSRLLLAASRNFTHRTHYYLFDNSYGLHRSADVKVAAELSRRLHLPLQVVMPGKVREDFLCRYENTCFFPRIMPKTANIQWHYDTHRSAPVVNLNGNCGEIARFHYSNKAVRDNHLERLITIAGFNGYFGNRIKEWHGGAAQFCAATGMNIYDLFYWEQRMSNWGALYPFEQDIAIEEFTPYNHKNLLYALLQIEERLRKGPGYPFIKELMSILWPETLSVPFNPTVGLKLGFRTKRIVAKLVGKK